MRAIVGMDVIALVPLVGSARKLGSTFFLVRILGTPIVNAASGAFLMLLACIGKRGRRIVFIVAAAVVALAPIGSASLLQHGGEAAAPHQWQSRQ